MNLIVAQRLVRRICKDCKTEHKYLPEELKALGGDTQGVRRRYLLQGHGLRPCNGTGYKGRAGLYEVMSLSPELRRMILQGRRRPASCRSRR